MLGAIIGDMVGSPYEGRPARCEPWEIPLFHGRSRPTDDTVMSLAVAEGIMNGRGDDARTREEIIDAMHRWGASHPRAGYGGTFAVWLRERRREPYNSFGNGSAMRVSAAGWCAAGLEEAERLARISAEVTHNHPEGVKGAVSVASAIFLARSGASKGEIRRHIEASFGYDLSRSWEEVRAACRFDVSCQVSVPEAFIAFLDGSSFEDVVRRAAVMGGDADTQAAIAGSMAEAMHGIPEPIAVEALKRLDEPMRVALRNWRKWLRERRRAGSRAAAPTGIPADIPAGGHAGHSASTEIPMLGAIVGDMVGCPHEFLHNKCEPDSFPLFIPESRPTDDTVMSLAVAEGIMAGRGDDARTREEIIDAMHRWGDAYPHESYGANFGGWLRGRSRKPYGSLGNGSAMRVSAAGWCASSLEEAERLARISAEVTHNHPEGVKGAVSVASAIYLARNGASREEIRRHIEERCGYDLSRSWKDVHAACTYSERSPISVPEAIMAFLASESFEDAIRRAVSLGGDADTQAAIAGSIAEAFYGGVPADIAAEALKRLDGPMRAALENWRQWLQKRRQDAPHSNAPGNVGAGGPAGHPAPPKGFMLGAIVGDMVGCPHEFHPPRCEPGDIPLFAAKSRPTDDSVMTLAVAEGFMAGWGDEKRMREEIVAAMHRWGASYPHAGYGGRFGVWIRERRLEPYGSYGNGSAMRVSAAGWCASSLEEAEHLARISAEVSHSSPEGIRGARAVASAIFLARRGASKEEIRRHVEERYYYDLSRSWEEVRATCTFDETCQVSVPEAFAAFLDGTSFEDVIRRAAVMGGDADTQAAIAGSIAEAFYGGVPEDIAAEALKRLDAPMRAALENWRQWLQERRETAAEGGDPRDSAAEEIIRRLGMERLEPEGGFWCPAYRSGTRNADGGCSCGSILYLITPESFSHFHRLTVDEIFHFCSGDAAEQIILDPDGGMRIVRLGPDVAGGDAAVSVVPAGCWQAARLAPGGRFALLAATTVPGYEDGCVTHATAAELAARHLDAAAGILRFQDADENRRTALFVGLARFVDAQKDSYAGALAEIRGGRKRSHWMWYVFPQVAGLGHSHMSRKFALSGPEEARAYLSHPILGPRLKEISGALLELAGSDAGQVFGEIDAMKLRSSMTLFQLAAPEERIFADVLKKFFGGRPDERTIALCRK